MILEPILEKLSTIASGATTIGSTGRAPDDDRKHRLLIRIVIDFIVDKIKLEEVSLPLGEICDLLEKTTRQFLTLKQSNKAGVIKVVILELLYRDKT
jgi:hypothetical protein